MKLFILKLLSLFVLCLGALSLSYAIGITVVTDYVGQLPQQLTDLKNNLPEGFAWAADLLDIKLIWLVASIGAIVFGIYGFTPRFSKWKRPKRISYDGPHGQVMIQLDTVEQSLNSVLARMPEVKKIDVTVEPRDGGRSALIKANAVLQHQPGQNARAIAGLVSDFIAETATKMLGLEELATIELNVTGINVNSRKSSKAIRKESLSHSANAPVELLEASPKPMALAAPGQPLGSGPVEEELEEEEPDSALEARAVNSAEEETRKASARSELLEPLSLHSIENEAEKEGGEASGETDHATTDDDDCTNEEPVPDIVEKSVRADDLSVSVVPEPLGDLDEDGDDEEEDVEEEEVDEYTEAEDGDEDEEETLAHVEEDLGHGSADVEVPVHFPAAAEVDAYSEEATPDDAPPLSPWAAVAAEATTEASSEIDAPSDFGDGEAVSEVEGLLTPSDDSEDTIESIDELDESTEDLGDTTTDSLLGDMSQEVDGDVVEGEPVPEEAAPEEGEKKRWGWFN